jgi:transcriptional regulator with XRE-family HTH domain
VVFRIRETTMTPQETFVTQLRRHRQKNRVSLDEIAVEARVKRVLLEALENNDVSEWPRGLYARALIRTYASFVGLDPLDTVDEFCRLFPQGDRRAQATIQEIAAIVASPSEYRDEFPHPEDRRRTGKPEEDPTPKLAWWQLPLTTLWMRVASAAAPHVRARRSAGPS